MSRKLSGLALSIGLTLSAPALAHDAECANRLVARGGWTGQYVILDTNVLLNDPHAIHKFPGAHVIIPGTVLEELDNIKVRNADQNLAWAARETLRSVWGIVEKNPDHHDMPIGEGSMLTVDLADHTALLKGETTLDPKKNDNAILAMALEYSRRHGPANVTMISNDTNVLIKSKGLKVAARQYEPHGPRVQKEEKSEDALKEIEISDEAMAKFKESGILRKPKDVEIFPNEFAVLKSPSTPAGEETVVRFKYDRTQADPELQYLHALPSFEKLPFKPLNLEQKMALDVLMDPTIDLVVIDAKAGTGKTFLTMLAAYTQYHDGQYKQVYVSKPNVSMGEALGYLPGDMGEKFEPWMQPYIDNLSQIKAGPKASAEERKSIKRLEQLPKGFEILPLAFLRGRTLPDSMIVIDEFQNTTEHQAKTILTRAGIDTKVVVMGDPSQIDLSPTYVNASNNGLSLSGRVMLSPKMSLEERSTSARVKLHVGVRSRLAELASKAFDQYSPLD